MKTRFDTLRQNATAPVWFQSCWFPLPCSPRGQSKVSYYREEELSGLATMELRMDLIQLSGWMLNHGGHVRIVTDRGTHTLGPLKINHHDKRPLVPQGKGSDKTQYIESLSVPLPDEALDDLCRSEKVQLTICGRREFTLRDDGSLRLYARAFYNQAIDTSVYRTEYRRLNRGRYKRLAISLSVLLLLAAIALVITFQK